MNELNQYNAWLITKYFEWESRCHRCGACCGAFDDPCENLRLAQEHSWPGDEYCGYKNG